MGVKDSVTERQSKRGRDTFKVMDALSFCLKWEWNILRKTEKQRKRGRDTFKVMDALSFCPKWEWNILQSKRGIDFWYKTVESLAVPTKPLESF
jgi:hypothetical protein